MYANFISVCALRLEQFAVAAQSERVDRQFAFGRTTLGASLLISMGKYACRSARTVARDKVLTPSAIRINENSFYVPLRSSRYSAPRRLLPFFINFYVVLSALFRVYSVCLFVFFSSIFLLVFSSLQLVHLSASFSPEH